MQAYTPTYRGRGIYPVQHSQGTGQVPSMLMKTQAGFWYATASTMPCHALWAMEHASYRLRLDRGTGQVLSVGTAPLTCTHQGGSSIVRLWLPLLAGAGWQGGCLSHPLPAGGTPPPR